MSSNDNKKDMKLICVICNKKIDDIDDHLPTQPQIEYIKRAFHIPRGHSGIDVAIDSSKFHNYFNTCDTQEIRRKVEYVLSKEFGEERFKWDYSYDEYGDSVGACAHHISLRKNN